MQIQIVTTTLSTKPTARGSYQELEVVYKNLTFQGKVESKKLMSFGAGAPSFKVLGEAAAGQVYDITVVKNDKGYNDWTAATQGVAGVGQQEQPTTGLAQSKGTPVGKSTYETAEERAQRQVLIVRQSSISSAVAALAAGAKSPPKVDDVIGYARSLEQYVFGLTEAAPANTGPTGFDDLPDFPEVN